MVQPQGQGGNVLHGSAQPAEAPEVKQVEALVQNRVRKVRPAELNQTRLGL